MKLTDLDRHEDIGNKPITLAVQWLRTLLKNPAWVWNEEQRKGCTQIADQVENMLELDVQQLGVELHPAGTQDLLDRMTATLKQIKVRLAFMGWPAESYWNGNHAAGQARWIPDWRKEIALVENCLHGTEVDQEKLARWKTDTTPWNQIDKEELPADRGDNYAQALHSRLDDLVQWIDCTGVTKNPALAGMNTKPLESARRVLQAQLPRKLEVVTPESADLLGRLHELMRRCRIEKHVVTYADLMTLSGVTQDAEGKNTCNESQ